MTGTKLEKRRPHLTALICAMLFVTFPASTPAQKLPNEIRGYKVCAPRVKVGNSTACDSKDRDSDALVTIGEPRLDSVSFTGMTIEISAEICSLEQSGRIDFLTFRDIRVNGVAVEIEEYRDRFQFKKNTPVSLLKPAKIFIGSRSIVKAAYKELVESKDEWSVTGTVLVFGRFKKMGFSVKRVVPIKIDFKIRNPVIQ